MLSKRRLWPSYLAIRRSWPFAIGADRSQLAYDDEFWEAGSVLDRASLARTADPVGPVRRLGAGPLSPHHRRRQSGPNRCDPVGERIHGDPTTRAFSRVAYGMEVLVASREHNAICPRRSTMDRDDRHMASICGCLVKTSFTRRAWRFVLIAVSAIEGGK